LGDVAVRVQAAVALDVAERRNRSEQRLRAERVDAQAHRELARRRGSIVQRVEEAEDGRCDDRSCRDEARERVEVGVWLRAHPSGHGTRWRRDASRTMRRKRAGTSSPKYRRYAAIQSGSSVRNGASMRTIARIVINGTAQRSG